MTYKKPSLILTKLEEAPSFHKSALPGVSPGIYVGRGGVSLTPCSTCLRGLSKKIFSQMIQDRYFSQSLTLLKNSDTIKVKPVRKTKPITPAIGFPSIPVTQAGTFSVYSIT